MQVGMFSDVIRMEPQGLVGERAHNMVQNWLSVAPYANYSVFESFFRRDALEPLPLATWGGEFPGKLLTGIAECMRIGSSQDRQTLRQVGEFVVRQLQAAQGEDGYLGIFSRKERLVGTVLEGACKTGDLWGHYHCMYALLLWYRQTGDETAVEICRKAADYLCEFFLSGEHEVAEAGLNHFNAGVIHVFSVLYTLYGQERYLQMAKDLCRTFLNGPYLEPIKQGQEFYQTDNPRWEILHAFEALPYLGEEKAFCRLWNSIRRTDVHNTGAFSTGEGANGNPYPIKTDEAWRCSIELCCSIAWTAMTVDYLRLTKDMGAADDLERCFYNALLGSQHPTGRWVTYNSPMLGKKIPSTIMNSAQANPGGPDFNCCAANGGRIIGTLSEWAVMVQQEQLYLNYYGAGSICTSVQGQEVTVSQRTGYPADGRIEICLHGEQSRPIELCLRIPCWSTASKLTVNGEEIAVQAGEYVRIRRVWKETDTVVLELDMSLHYLISDERYDYRVSVFRGPLLLAADEHWNDDICSRLPTFDFRHMEPSEGEAGLYPQPLVCLTFPACDGRRITLTDFATAGMTGTPYTTWFDFADAQQHREQAAESWSYRP